MGHYMDGHNLMGQCTMPKIPFFRDWFEERFGDLCERHDAEYAFGDCKLCADWRFVLEIGKRGYWPLVPFVFLAVNLPWVWLEYFFDRRKRK